MEASLQFGGRRKMSPKTCQKPAFFLSRHLPPRFNNLAADGQEKVFPEIFLPCFRSLFLCSWQESRKKSSFRSWGLFFVSLASFVIGDLYNPDTSTKKVSQNLLL